ncbi:MAG: DUF2207 domain-containing protein [Bacilli bacterium]
MKKIILSLVMFLLMPLTALAVNYDITDYYIEANLLENGDASVKELMVLDGTFNGYEMNLFYNTDNSIYNASNITNVKVSGKTITNKVSFDTFNDTFTLFDKVNYAEVGSSNKYVITPVNNGYSYKMFYKTSNSKTAFLLEYTLNDVLVMHEDVMEFYWSFFDTSFNDAINNLNIKVYLPKKDTSDNFRIWAHGNLTGNISFIDEPNKSGLLATIKPLEPNSQVSIRTIFDKSLINPSLIKKSSFKASKDEILKEEEKNAETANNLRLEARRLMNNARIMTISYILLIIIFWVLIYFKYDKERKSNFLNKYNREFIDDYNVEVIDYLMNKNITSNAMSASIMNLIYKKNIIVEEIQGKKKKEYTFILKNKDKINDTEEYLINFLFNTVGTNNSFTTEDLKKYAGGTKTCNEFMDSFTKWKNKVIEDGKKENFFELHSKQIIFSLIFIILAVIIMVYINGHNIAYPLSYIIPFLAVFFFIYTLMVTKKTVKGIEHYSKWKAFKNFLNDFGTFETKELPEVILWERYLVYATIFGLADKVEKAINVKINEMSIDDQPVFIYPYYIAPIIDNSINSSISAAQTRITEQLASSSDSSGSGFGGGFSSGGFGGGGRSGGGF